MSKFTKALSIGKELGKGMIETVQKRNERILKTKENLERYDDDYVIKKFKNSSGETKMAAALVLKDRGLIQPK